MTSEDLQLLIKEGEGLMVEFKEKYSTKIVQDIVAFANTKGGSILFGVDDHCTNKGETLTNKMKAEIVDLARNCEPSIHIKSIKQIDKVVAVEVAEGDEKPYSCAAGYYRRLDAVTQKMTQKEIHLIYKNVTSTSFEEQINKDASWDDISKEKIKAFFKEAGISVSKILPREILSSLNLANNTAIKNAGVLFFANRPRDLILQCQMTLVAFKGTDRINIYDRQDVQDDLLIQFNEAIMFLQKHLNIRSEIKGTDRKDIYEIPLEALREAVANAIIHRDYSMRGTSIMIEVHQDKVVISNPGGLMAGLENRFFADIFVRRNEHIADMFARMDKMERMGTGISRMRSITKAAGVPKPKFTTNLFFTTTFKRPTHSLKGSEKMSEIMSEKASEIMSEKILGLIIKNKNISSKKIAEILDITPRSVERKIATLKAMGHLKRIGSPKTGHWEIAANKNKELD
jgi:ATP-dependent DNA helicase RecG